MLTYHELVGLESSWEQFHRNFSKYQFEKLLFQNYYRLSERSMSERNTTHIRRQQQCKIYGLTMTDNKRINTGKQNAYYVHGNKYLMDKTATILLSICRMLYVMYGCLYITLLLLHCQFLVDSCDLSFVYFRLFHWALLLTDIYFNPHIEVFTCPVKCATRLTNHSQTSTIASRWKFPIPV